MSSKSFSVIEVVKESCVSVWENWRDWLKLGLLPLGLYFVFSVLHLLLANPSLQMPGMFIGIAFSIVFTVRSLRYVLLSEMPSSWLEWNKIHWKMSLYTLLFLSAWVLFMILGSIVGMIFYFMLQQAILVPLVVGPSLLLVSLYFYGRVTLAYAALSVENPNPLTESWQKSKGINGFKIMGVLALIILPFLVIAVLMTLIVGTWDDLSYVFNKAFIDPENAGETLHLILAEKRPRILLRSLASLPFSFALFVLLAQVTALVYKKVD